MTIILLILLKLPYVVSDCMCMKRPSRQAYFIANFERRKYCILWFDFIVQKIFQVQTGNSFYPTFCENRFSYFYQTRVEESKSKWIFDTKCSILIVTLRKISTKTMNKSNFIEEHYFMITIQKKMFDNLQFFYNSCCGMIEYRLKCFSCFCAAID